MDQTMEPARRSRPQSKPDTAPTMRQSVNDRVERWTPGATVILTFEHQISSAKEPLMSYALEQLQRAVANMAGFTYFRPRKSISRDSPEVVQFDTYEEWSSAAAGRS